MSTDAAVAQSVPGGLLHRLHLRLAALLAVRGARARSLERADRLAFRRILVLCYGNIYRSPLVAAYLHRAFAGRKEIEIRSAGFHPKPDRSSSEDFVRHVRERTGLDLSGHRSRVLTCEDLQWADSILIMDRHNWHALARGGLVHMEKVVWLGAFLPQGSLEIVDPYGRSDKDMHRIVDSVTAASKALGEHLKITHSNPAS